MKRIHENYCSDVHNETVCQSSTRASSQVREKESRWLLVRECFREHEADEQPCKSEAAADRSKPTREGHAFIAFSASQAPRRKVTSRLGVPSRAVKSRRDTEESYAVPSRLRRFVEEAQPSIAEQDLDNESRECAIALARVAWDTKAEDISVLNVAPLVYWCSYMVLLNVGSRPQLQAVIAKVEREAAEKWDRRIPEEAITSRGSSWEVLDFQDVVVHVFTAEQRQFYDLDSYYGLAEEVELPFLSSEASGPQWSRSAISNA